MIRCTHNLLLILVAVLVLTGCTSLAVRTAGIQPTEKIIARAATAGSAPATEALLTPTRAATAVAPPTATFTASPTHTPLPTATVTQAAAPSATATATPTRPTPPSIPTPAATPTPEPPAVTVRANANIRAGPGAAYPIIGGARAGDRLSVIGRFSDWWQIARAGRTGWIWGGLVASNVAAGQAPQVTDFPPPPTVEVKVEAKAEPTATPISTSASASSLPDLVVFGPETQYPVRAQRIRGDGYEFVDASSQYDLVLQRDVYGAVIRQFWGDQAVRAASAGHSHHPAGPGRAAGVRHRLPELPRPADDSPPAGADPLVQRLAGRLSRAQPAGQLRRWRGRDDLGRLRE